MMNKDSLNTWNTLKQDISQYKNRSFVNEREICFVHLGENIGFEQNGKSQRFERPVVVFKKFGKNTFIALPLTSKKKTGPFYFPFSFNKKQSYAILSQIRLLDTKRIVRKIGYMEKEPFQKLKQKLKIFLDL